jgi:hypothetical protein
MKLITHVVCRDDCASSHADYDLCLRFLPDKNPIQGQAIYNIYDKKSMPRLEMKKTLERNLILKGQRSN